MRDVTNQRKGWWQEFYKRTRVVLHNIPPRRSHKTKEKEPLKTRTSAHPTSATGIVISVSALALTYTSCEQRLTRKKDGLELLAFIRTMLAFLALGLRRSLLLCYMSGRPSMLCAWPPSARSINPRQMQSQGVFMRVMPSSMLPARRSTQQFSTERLFCRGGHEKEVPAMFSTKNIMRCPLSCVLPRTEKSSQTHPASAADSVEELAMRHDDGQPCKSVGFQQARIRSPL